MAQEAASMTVRLDDCGFCQLLNNTPRDDM